ncbi:hypothetical protein Taro_035481 [Colocasia esculenta]|uniref:Uncharacterized protein n=1 Tax=Colocasia esculenta TaxID=4460 RepID=A0A843W3X9_COLES|nr:hypothetical protein [Colocasia esculenta]
MGRSPCCERAHINKGAWTKEEDDLLVAHIREHGEGCWRSLPKAAGLLRCGKSCRLRWINYLRPDLKRGNFTAEEDGLIIKLHGLLGNKWSLIASRLPGRTDNEIKNYWNTHIRRKLLSSGIDPSTHRPISQVSISFTDHKGDYEKAVVAGGLLREEERCSSQERCSSSAASQTPAPERDPTPLPDLNLDLCITMPHEQQRLQSSSGTFEGRGRGLCFGCSILGPQKSRECNCDKDEPVLGLGRRVLLDFRDLDMKL